MKTIYLTTIIAAAVSGSAFSQNRSDQTVLLDVISVKNLGIETVLAEESTFASTVLVLGEIEHTCESHTVLASRIAGRISEVRIHEGEFTKKDETLALVESRQPGDPPPVVELKSPGSGLVVRSEAHLGAPVEPGTGLLEILDLTTVWAVAAVPQTEGPILQEGLKAKIRIPAVKDGDFEGEFFRLGPKANAEAGTIEAIFAIPNPDNKLRPGMRAELTLKKSERTGVLSVPRASVQGDASSKFVFIKDYEIPDAFVKSPVVIGATTGDRVEIKSGLFPGDEVVTKGSYALSFAGKGSGSLKEALDAAHGHPHKEDGTEMSSEEAAAAAGGAGEGGHHHDHGSARSPLTIFLGVACVILFALLMASTFLRNRSKA